MLVTLLVVFNSFLVISMAAPPAEHNGRTFRNALNQQGLQTILQSIEERLRNLDQIYSVRYVTPSINDQFIRKIEFLENKISRMENQIEIQLQKISENMSSKNFKDDIAKDQFFRKMDSVYERINHKVSYVEAKIDMDVLKLQTKIETGISKIERLDHSFTVRQADIEAEVSDAVEMMENVKNNVANIESKLMNITKITIENTVDKQTNIIYSKLDSVTNLITQIDKRVNNSLQQCYQKDVLNDFTNKDTHLTKTFKGYEDQIQNYGNKMSNMYNELWKKSSTLENTIKHSVLLMNLTRKDIQELKKAGHKFTTYNSQNDGQLEVIVDSFTNTIQRKFAELGRKLDSNFENVMLVQNLFLESCHRIQIDESQLENKISLVLEKLLDAVTNRSINTFKEIQSMEELIKSHDSNVYRTLTQNTNTIIKLSEKTSEDRKKLEKILSTIRKDISNALETIQNEINSEDQDNTQKFDTLANILLELQEQVNDLDRRVNEDNINYNAKQILQDIKDFPALNTTLEDLSKLTSRIYHLLTSIDTRINTNELSNQRVHDLTQENTRVDEREPEHFVLEVFPEDKHSALSRFNYTLINDEINEKYSKGNEIITTPNNLERTTKYDEIETKNYEDYLEIPVTTKTVKSGYNKFKTEITNNEDSIVDKETKQNNELTSEKSRQNMKQNQLNTEATRNEDSIFDKETIIEKTGFIIKQKNNEITTVKSRKNMLKTEATRNDEETIEKSGLTTKRSNELNSGKSRDNMKQNNIEKETTTENLGLITESNNLKRETTKNEDTDNAFTTEKLIWFVPEIDTNQNNFEIDKTQNIEKGTKYEDIGIVINSNPDLSVNTNAKGSNITTEKSGLPAKHKTFEANYIELRSEKSGNFKTEPKENFGTVINDNPEVSITTKIVKDNEITTEKSGSATKHKNFEANNNEFSSEKSDLETETKQDVRVIIIGSTEIPITHKIFEDNNNKLRSEESGKFETETNQDVEIVYTTRNSKNNEITTEKSGCVKQNNTEKETKNDNNGIGMNGSPDIPEMPYSGIVVNSERTNIVTNEETKSKPTTSDTSTEIVTEMLDTRTDVYEVETTEYSINDTNSKANLESDASVEIVDIALKGFASSKGESRQNKNENNENNINVHKIVTNTNKKDIPVADTLIKTTKRTTGNEELLESATQGVNSFEYTDLKNNTNEEYNRDEYEWDYDD